MKTAQTLLAALALTLPLAGASAQSWTTNNLPSGLIAWWQAESNYLDSVGTNQGAPVGGVTFSPARVGQGFVFSGTNQGVIIPHDTSLNVPPTGFTVEFWIKASRDQAESISSIVDKDHSAQDNTGWEVSCWRDTGRLSFGIGDGSSFPLFTNRTDVLDNQFHHIAFAWDKTNWLIYVNGALENSLYRPNVANNTRPLRFGYHWGDGTGTPIRHFKGSLDEVRLYNRALTATEIARLALNLPGATGVWGLKTHDPLSQPPTTMFWFDENGANYREVGRVTLAGGDVEADGLAMSPTGGLFAFQVDAVGGARLLALNSTTAVASVVGPVLTGRNIRGATFTLSGRLLAFDFARKELVEVSPSTGLEVGTAVPLSTNLNATSTAGDLTQMPDGSLLFAYHAFLYRLDSRTGSLVQLHEDKVALADGYIPYNCGVVCAPGSEPANKLYCYEASMNDDVYQYLPSAGFARTQLYNHIVPSYNAGRGDLAALPAARVELLNFSVSGTNASLETVCRGGVLAWVEFTDDLAAQNWQPVPGTSTVIPFADGSIATPKTWTNLPASTQTRFFRITTQ